MKKLLLLGLSAFIFLIPQSTIAQESIKNFDVVIEARKNGQMSIEENINYDFGEDERHGIFRNIPLVSKVGDLFRTITLEFIDIRRDGIKEKHEFERASKETSVKIGDPDKTYTGEQTYTIRYTVKNGIGSNYEDHDEIYWNVTGDEWNVPIKNASVFIKTDFNVLPEKLICFTGSEGLKESNCIVEEIPGGKKVSLLKPLNSYEGLTIVSSFPVNTFPKSILQKNEPFADPDFISFLKIYIPIALGLNLILAPYLLFWYFKNKSKVRFGNPPVNFEIPRENKDIVTPAEAGIVDNTKLERDDVIATIFDLAIRRYLKIEEVKKVKALRPDETDYKFIKLKDYDGNKKFEVELFGRLFKSGDEVLMSDLKKDFYLTFNKLEREVFDSLVLRNFFTKNPKNQMAGFLIFGIIALATFNLLLGTVLIFLSRKLTGRTQLGDKIDFQVDGLKIFLKSMSRHHKFQAENLITVEKYIPYAIALGLHQEFMDQLKIINPDYRPTWYSGSNNFYYGYSGMYSSMNSNVTTSAPSSSSGFSGGGSSGGGGGGGGGGSW